MRPTAILLIMLALSSPAAAGDLADTYCGGPVRLTVDPNFGSQTDWNRLFGDDGSGAEVVVASDGTVFVLHRGTKKLFKLDSQGRLLREFGGDFGKTPHLHGILDDQYLLLSESDGTLSIIGSDGRLVENQQLDYVPLDCIPLSGGKFAVRGHVPYGGGDVRYIIAVREVGSDSEEIIHSFIKEYDESRSINIKANGRTMVVGNPYARTNMLARRTPDGRLVIGRSDQGRVQTISANGTTSAACPLDIERTRITQKDKDEFVEAITESVKKMCISVDEVSEIYTTGFFGDFLPYFHNFMLDSEGNLLVMVYSSTEDEDRARVYSFDSNCRFLCETTLECEDYDLGFGDRYQNMQFHAGFLYAVVGDNGSMEVKRFKLSN